MVLSYLIVTATSSHLFIDASKVANQNIATHLLMANVKVHPYESIELFLKDFTAESLTNNNNDIKVMVDPVQLNWRLYQAIPPNCILEKVSLATILKAIKNNAELEGIRKCHIRDGAALTAFLFWLEESVKSM